MEARTLLTDDAEILRRLYQCAAHLGAATHLEEIASLAARAACEVMGGRGVLVQLWEGAEPGGLVDAGAGPEMSPSMHRQTLVGSLGEVGEIIVDAPSPLDDVEREVLAMIAAPTTSAVCHFRIQRERDTALQGAVLALARLAECRDQETGHHIERVSQYSVLVAENLRAAGHFKDEITEDFLRDLRRAAPLHDIGKVGIPDSVLLKPGKLSPEEWELMKTHAELGAATLDDIVSQDGRSDFLLMGRDVAWCHHERWDGTGYPRGLAEEQIPLAARIVAIADIYDALTSDRPYKRAWSHAAAVEWISGLAGSHLDPRVVVAFLSRLPEVETIRRRLSDGAQSEDPEATERLT